MSSKIPKPPRRPRKRGAVFRGFWPVRLIAAASYAVTSLRLRTGSCRTHSDPP
ncbi:MAG: hypothetical protein ORN98_09105 [Alphaproteobacteria bacterium]|nr:hypothetical protein [Alphaproteobacteria bacterium]